mmetsp:Transcript_12155/g.27751  ORF Transcript_12155/g.27751 Transcript_12155/m.27751 type:complete len:223 (-) Transcript_12155:281-949(-)
MVLLPLDPELFSHEGEVGTSVFGRSDTTRWLEAHLGAGPLVILPNRAAHYERHGERGVGGLLASRCLDEIGSRHHAHQAALIDERESGQLSRCENRLHVRRSTRLAEVNNLLVQRLPVAGQRVRARDHNINLHCAIGYTLPDLGKLVCMRDLTCGKASGDRRDRDAGALECGDGVTDAARVHADCAALDVEAAASESCQHVGANGVHRFRTKALHIAWGIVA